MDPDADPGGPKTYRSYGSGSGCRSGFATRLLKIGKYRGEKYRDDVTTDRRKCAGSYILAYFGQAALLVWEHREMFGKMSGH